MGKISIKKKKVCRSFGDVDEDCQWTLLYKLPLLISPQYCHVRYSDNAFKQNEIVGEAHSPWYIRLHGSAMHDSPQENTISAMIKGRRKFTNQQFPPISASAPNQAFNSGGTSNQEVGQVLPIWAQLFGKGQ